MNFQQQTDAKTENRFIIRTLGCKVNQYESQAMREILLRSGFKECFSKEIADIYIINSCTVTEEADKEARYLINFFRRKNPNARIVVTGCYAEKDFEEIASIPGVSRVLKNENKTDIARILGFDHMKTGKESLKITGFKDHTKAFVKIQDGCENSCSYCKVPLVRGPLRSKPINDILTEVSGLVDNGYKEIILTGICLGAWGRDLFPAEVAKRSGLDGAGLLDSLKALDTIKGDFRIRLSSIEPKYVTDELINFIASSGRICKHLHIPLQSGDDDILKKMNRPYDTNDYKMLIEKIRKKINNAAITTDILTGFPGETDAHARDTLRFVKEMMFARMHIFTFSAREGTSAFNMEGRVAREISKRRYYELSVASTEMAYIYKNVFLGCCLNVLVENKRDKKTGMLEGYSDNYIKVLFDGPDSLMKSVVPVNIKYVNLHYTIGEVEKIS